MTKPPNEGARSGSAKRPTRDPYGLLPSGVPIAALAAIVGLVIIGFVTLGLTQGQLPITPGGGNGGGPQASDEIPARTPTPSNIVIVPSPEPGIEVAGTLVYAKDGNIWVQTGDQATQLTAPGKEIEDSMPSFSQDGKSVYFVRTRRTDGKWSIDGEVKDYRLDVPTLMRVNVADGKTERLLDGIVDPPGPFKWNGFIREPVVSPDGRYVAMASDLPDPTTSDVTLKLFDLKNDKIRDLGLQQVAPLGHQDPAWRPDGGRLLYVLNDRDGAKGTPRIYAWNPDTAKAKPVTGPGYLHPAWSPDGRYIAATKTSAYGTDVVILSATSGAELARLTDDGNSWAPAWSPRGDQIAYLHVAGQVIDLRMAQLEGSGPTWTVKETLDLTTAAGLDGVSRPGWFVPPEELPAVTPVPLARGLAVALVTPYLDRLGARTAATGSVLCLGVDPDPDALPAGFPPTLDGVERFARLVVEAALPYAAAVKPNLAFFEAHGSAGIAALERLRALVPSDIPFVADAKRGDIGSTAARQAIALFDALGADAVTVSPYLGEAAIEPLLARVDRFAYVLCRTSNPGAEELQGLVVAGDPSTGAPLEALWARVARRAASWGPGGTVGLVVGATAPAELAAIRSLAPGLAFLVPGVGAQGGEVAPVLAGGPATAAPAGGRPGGGLLVNVSRGIAQAALGEPTAGGPRDPGERLAEAAAEWAKRLAVLP